jgi:hypothetical protein
MHLVVWVEMSPGCDAVVVIAVQLVNVEAVLSCRFKTLQRTRYVHPTTLDMQKFDLAHRYGRIGFTADRLEDYGFGLDD